MPMWFYSFQTSSESLWRGWTQRVYSRGHSYPCLPLTNKRWVDVIWIVSVLNMWAIVRASDKSFRRDHGGCWLVSKVRSVNKFSRWSRSLTRRRWQLCHVYRSAGWGYFWQRSADYCTWAHLGSGCYARVTRCNLTKTAIWNIYNTIICHMHLDFLQKKASQLILSIALHSYTLKKEMCKAVHFAVLCYRWHGVCCWGVRRYQCG